MTGPVGLTRAEEAREQQQPEVRVVVVAPPGVLRCTASVPPAGDDCRAAATGRIVWPDGQVSPVCGDCALRLNQQAVSFHTTLRIEPVR